MNWHENDRLMEHYDRIKRYIAYKAGTDQAEDLTQQVFLQAHQSLNSFQNKSNLYTWLYSIASNLMINEARRAYRTKELPVGQEIKQLTDSKCAPLCGCRRDFFECN